MKRTIIFIILLVGLQGSTGLQSTFPDPLKEEMDVFISDLLARMTLEEKIGQLNLVSVGFDVTGPIVSKNVEEKIHKGQVGGVFNTFTPTAVRKLQQMAVTQTRLKIPLLFGFDVIHGHRTIFPIPLGLSCSWDMESIKLSARIAAEEASADGLNWVFSPMVDITRDPRWGRIAEGSGEDTFLGSLIAASMVQGYQGEDLSANNTVLACVKHFALYGASEAGRDYNPVDMSDRTMFQFYLPPYKTAIDVGAGSVMTSFNEINGVPATANKWLMYELLRKKWGFNGLLVTDYTALSELVQHGVGDEAEVTRLAMEASVDMDMVSEFYLNDLGKLNESGRISADQITMACKRVLEAKYKLGLFEDPYRYVNQERSRQTFARKEFINASREIARKSFVLLKNENKILPLKKVGSIALIGPLAKDQRDLIGNWSGAGDWHQAVSVEQGIKNIAGNAVTINYAKGANITDDPQLISRLNAHGGNLEIDQRTSSEMIDEAVQVAKRSDLIVAVVGESQGMSGEAASRSEITLPGTQLDLLKALKQTAKPLVIILMNGRPLAIKWEAENADAILETWFAGTEAGNAIADVLFGLHNPSGKLTTTFPQSVGQVPLYYNHKNTGRPFDGALNDKYKSRYMDVSNDPLFAFGYGLSYTSFKYSDLKLSQTEMKHGETILVSVVVTNAGDFDGEEAVQLYIQDVMGSVTRPVRELKGFKKVMLKRGEVKTISFSITEEDLKFYDINMDYVAEPGEFNIFVGTDSQGGLTSKFRLVE
ncbi:MAG TPA: beta-glucosidase BglX [Cyclobacteriaceae bacterium]|nr:beta-glucosidase BglX [Cyclobacteriaceae bacterium]